MAKEREQKIRYPVAGKFQICKTADQAMRQLTVAGDHTVVTPISGFLCGAGSTDWNETQDGVVLDLRNTRKEIEDLLSCKGQVKIGPF